MTRPPRCSGMRADAGNGGVRIFRAREALKSASSTPAGPALNTVAATAAARHTADGVAHSSGASSTIVSLAHLYSSN